jgi:PAS domain S-box-containing protein
MGEDGSGVCPLSVGESWHSMSWLAVIGSLIASACLMLAHLHRLVGWSKRTMRAIPAIAFPGLLLLRTVFLAGVISSPLLAEEHTAAPGKSVLPDVSRNNPIKVVYPVVMPPYAFEDDKGEAQGLAVDLLRLWSEKTGVPILFKSAAWVEGIRMMREGKADIHASLYLSEEREQYLTYAAIVASSQGMVFYHKSIVNISGLNDLKAFRVGVVQNSYHEQYIKQNVPEVSLVSYPDFPEMLLAAQKGDVRVFIEDTGATLYRLKERGLLDEFHYNPSQILYRNNFWIAVHKGNTKLAKVIKEGMALITPAERVTLERKWLPGSLIRTPGTLFIAMSDDFAPYSFINAEGKPAGLFVDIWKLWAEKTGKKVEFLPSNLDDSLNNARHGSVDIHSGLFRSENGAQWFDFSIPFYDCTSSLFYLRGQSKQYKERDRDLAGKKIGVLQGSYHEQYLKREHLGVNVIPFLSREKMVRAVAIGETSACLAEDASTSALLSRLGLSGMFDAEPLMPFAQTIHAGVPKGQAQLLSLVNEGFKAITKSEMASIQQRWVAGPEKESYQRLLKWFLVAAGAALALLCAFLLWNRSLSRMVKARTATLAESEERFRSTFEQAAVGIAHVSPEGLFLRINKKFCDILGYSREEMLQRTFQDITYPDDLGLDLKKANQMLSGEIDTYSMEKRYIRKDGELVWANLTVALLRNESGQPQWFVSVAQDISDRKESEQEILQQRSQLAHLSRVHQLGELSGSLAHELSQPLAAILINAQAAQRLLALGPINLQEARDIIEDIVADDKRASEVIGRLRLLFKKGETQHQLIKVNEIVRAVLKLAGSDMVNHHVTAHAVLAEDLPLVRGDQIQFQQVLLNLVMNACDAMANMEPEACQLMISTNLDGNGDVHISVTDSGTGIAPEMLERIFEPFHTTKSHGLGLGLAVCRTIVLAHAGKLWAANNPERGATFHFTLPAEKEKGKEPSNQAAGA